MPQTLTKPSNVGHLNMKPSLEDSLSTATKQLENAREDLDRFSAEQANLAADLIGYRKTTDKKRIAAIQEKITPLNKRIEQLQLKIKTLPGTIQELQRRIEARNTRQALSVKKELNKKIEAAESAWKHASKDFIEKLRVACDCQVKVARCRDRCNALKILRGDVIEVGQITVEGATVGCALLDTIAQMLEAEVAGQMTSRVIPPAMLVQLLRNPK